MVNGNFFNNLVQFQTQEKVQQHRLLIIAFIYSGDFQEIYSTIFEYLI